MNRVLFCKVHYSNFSLFEGPLPRLKKPQSHFAHAVQLVGTSISKLSLSTLKLLNFLFMATLEQIDNFLKTRLKALKDDIMRDLDDRIDSKVEAKLLAVNQAHAQRQLASESQIVALQDYTRKDNIIIHNFPYQFSDAVKLSDRVAGKEPQRPV